MYYHVLAKTSDDPKRWHVVADDLTKRELRQFVRRYEDGGAWRRSDGTVVDLMTVREIQLRFTEYRSDIERKRLEERDAEDAESRSGHGIVFISPGRGWRREDVQHVGRDVTARWIQREPGVRPPLRHALRNPWVTGAFFAVVGVLLTLLAQRLGILAAP